MSKFPFEAGSPVWVHTNSWAGHLRHAAIMVKVNAKRSKVKYLDDGTEGLAPNYSITERSKENLNA